MNTFCYDKISLLKVQHLLWPRIAQIDNSLVKLWHHAIYSSICHYKTSWPRCETETLSVFSELLTRDDGTDVQTAAAAAPGLIPQSDFFDCRPSPTNPRGGKCVNGAEEGKAKETSIHTPYLSRHHRLCLCIKNPLGLKCSRINAQICYFQCFRTQFFSVKFFY